MYINIYLIGREQPKTKQQHKLTISKCTIPPTPRDSASKAAGAKTFKFPVTRSSNLLKRKKKKI